MAQMFPRTLLESEVKSKGEVRVFNALRDQLDDGWHAFHSVGWVTRDHAEGSDDGEIDFVLAKVGEPIICLEVKGGGLECRYGEWYRIKDGSEERFRDPFAQAIDHVYDLKRHLEKAAAWKKRDVHIVQALSFPDISVHKLALAPDAPAEIVIDKSDVIEIEPALGRVLEFHRGSRDKRELLDEGGLAALTEILAPNVRIEVPMATDFLDEEEQLITLTHQQSMLLNRYGRDLRMVVTGCAGSGKTMLAVEQAKRLAAKGERVLFVCFNKGLRDHLRRKEEKSGVEFWNFHALCVRLANLAKIELPSYPKDQAPQEYWSEELPLAMIEAIDELGPQYDSLFVDEAQDLENDWLEALMTTLEDPEKAHVWLFMDDNQRVYEAKLDVPPEFRPFDLTVNCRNTQAIAREVHKKYKGEVESEMLGPPGRDVDFYETDDGPATVAALVQSMCGKHEVPPQDVVVLSAHGFEKSAVREVDAGGYEFVREPRTLGNYVQLSSIRAFKGLEAPAVILCELEDLDPETMDQQLYVGISRAKNHCAIVAPAA
jgi:hypothetical protein